MKYLVAVASKSTGNETTLHITAPSVADAEAQATNAGWLVSRVMLAEAASTLDSARVREISAGVFRALVRFSLLWACIGIGGGILAGLMAGWSGAKPDVSLAVGLVAIVTLLCATILTRHKS